MISEIVDPPERLRDAAQELGGEDRPQLARGDGRDQAGAVGRARARPHRRVQGRRGRARLDVGPSRPGGGPARVRGEARTAVGAARRLGDPTHEVLGRAPGRVARRADDVRARDRGRRASTRASSPTIRSRRASGSTTGGHETLDPFVALVVRGGGDAAAAAAHELPDPRVPQSVPHREVGRDARRVLARPRDPRRRGRLPRSRVRGAGCAVRRTGAPARRVAVGDEGGVGRTSCRTTSSRPRCVQQPHPPIWAGGNSAAAMRRAITHGDGWSPFPASPAHRGRGRHRVDDRRRDARQRDRAVPRAARPRPAAPSRSTCASRRSRIPGHKDIVDPAAFVAEAHELARIGVTWLAFHLPAPSVGEFCDTVAAFGEAVAEVRTS